MSNQVETTVITIEVGMTQQPESYTNVKRNITLPIFVKADDDITAIARAKMAEAVKIVENSIDDDFERGHGASAKYSDEPRYDYLYWNKKKLIVIIPSNLNDEEIPQGWHHLNKERRNDRLEFLKKTIKKRKDLKNHTILDCNQDFNALENYPEIYHGLLTWQPKHKIAILTDFEIDLPEEFKKKYPTTNWGSGWGRAGEIDFYENLINWAKEKAEEENCQLYICWEGDLSQVPPPITQPKPEPEPKDEEEDDDEEDDDEETAEDLF